MNETSIQPTQPDPRIGPRMGRRTMLAAGTAVPGTAIALGLADPAQAAGSSYFRHGVASGDPLPTAVVLWTRVTPTAGATPGSGRGLDVRVTWQVATDRRFRHVVRSGTLRTGAWRDHTVKVDARGLRPARWYYYRFHANGHASPVGRTRTAPATDSSPGHVRFGVVSCANLQAGWFHAYRGLADRDDLHAIVHLGDYLYEYGPGEYGYGVDDIDVRTHRPAHEIVTLADYRQRHAQYKQDPDLRRLHARYAFIATWDDHEVANDAWSGGAENHQPATEGSYAARKAAAHRAYDEWMPVRLSGTSALGDGTRIYRRLRFGTLLELSMLDLRTYRTEQGSQATTGDPDATITGTAQLDWLKAGLDHPVQWKIVGNPVMIAPVDFGTLPNDVVDAVGSVTGDVLPPDGLAYNVDQWDGYTADRKRLYAHLRDHQISDVVFITGDIHSGWACELPVDPGSYPLDSDTVGVEYVCTSVTSNNLKDLTGSRALSPAVVAAIRLANPHVKYLDFDDHGYSILDVTSERAQMDWYLTGDRATRNPGAPTWTRSFRTRAGTGRAVAVTTPVGV
ncbi:MAG: alkaline phosphatase D family protein [Nocardioides sp.]|uniref:alkaline phosphatase D family protein n=1 Tax=Nocardioides sp. TaxID=35761 RepID=UPI0039E526E1